VEKTVTAGRPRTLMQAHENLVRIRPGREASLPVWFAYYQRSAALYAEIAQIDSGHDGEALYWAQRERRRAEEIAAQLRLPR
jgi:hypothetical protein